MRDDVKVKVVVLNEQKDIKIEKNNLYNMDCLDGLRLLKNDSIDLTVTSPPYDNLRKYTKEFEKNSFDFESIAQELYRVTKEGGVVVWIVGDATIKGSESGTSFKQALYFKEVGFRLHDTMIYEKTGNPFPEVNRYYPCFEYMFIFSKGKPKTTNLISDRKNTTAGDKVHGRLRQPDNSQLLVHSLRSNKNSVVKDYGIRYNIWKYTNDRKSNNAGLKYKHPATFPDNLAKDHIITWSNPKDTVLDIFAGSGTTLRMAKALNRKYIGFEISKEYFKLANKLIKKQENFDD